MRPAVVLCLTGAPGAVWAGHPWQPDPRSPTLEQSVPPPEGFRRIPVKPSSFGDWLRHLPVLPGRPPVKLHSGALKTNQDAHHRIFDIDVGPRDLQQCADAVIRLFAEYQWATGRAHQVCFRYTSGHPVPWTRWRRGQRPQIRGDKVSWASRGPARPAFPRH